MKKAWQQQKLIVKFINKKVFKFIFHSVKIPFILYGFLFKTCSLIFLFHMILVAFKIDNEYQSLVLITIFGFWMSIEFITIKFNLVYWLKIFITIRQCYYNSRNYFFLGEKYCFLFFLFLIWYKKVSPHLNLLFNSFIFISFMLLFFSLHKVCKIKERNIVRPFYEQDLTLFSELLYEISKIYKDIWAHYYKLQSFEFKCLYTPHAKLFEAPRFPMCLESLMATTCKSLPWWSHNKWDVFKGRKIYRYDILWGLTLELIAVKNIWWREYFNGKNKLMFSNFAYLLPFRFFFSDYRLTKKNIFIDEDEGFFLYSHFRSGYRFLVRNTCHMYPVELLYRTFLFEKDPLSTCYFLNRAKITQTICVPFKGQAFFYYDKVLYMFQSEDSFVCKPSLFNRNEIVQKKWIKDLLYQTWQKNSLKSFFHHYAYRTRKPPYVHWGLRALIKWRKFFAIRSILKQYVIWNRN